MSARPSINFFDRIKQAFESSKRKNWPCILSHLGWRSCRGVIAESCSCRRGRQRSGREVFSVSWCLRERLSPDQLLVFGKCVSFRFLRDSAIVTPCGEGAADEVRAVSGMRDQECDAPTMSIVVFLPPVRCAQRHCQYSRPLQSRPSPRSLPQKTSPRWSPDSVCRSHEAGWIGCGFSNINLGMHLTQPTTTCR